MSIHQGSNEIGKLFVGSNQIGKVYKGDVLIYTAEDYLLKSGVAQTLVGGFTHYAQQYNSELTYPSGYMQLKNTNSGSYSRVDSNKQIDWSQYSTLYVQVGATTVPTYSTFTLAIAKGSVDSGKYLYGNDSTYYSLYKQWNNPSAAIEWEEDKILEFDVSSIITTGKLMFGMVHNVGTWKIKNIWVE